MPRHVYQNCGLGYSGVQHVNGTDYDFIECVVKVAFRIRIEYGVLLGWSVLVVINCCESVCIELIAGSSSRLGTATRGVVARARPADSLPMVLFATLATSSVVCRTVISLPEGVRAVTITALTSGSDCIDGNICQLNFGMLFHVVDRCFMCSPYLKSPLQRQAFVFA